MRVPPVLNIVGVVSFAVLPSGDIEIFNERAEGFFVTFSCFHLACEWRTLVYSQNLLANSLFQLSMDLVIFFYFFL